MKERLNKLLLLLIGVLKIGFLGFGGGSALIPIIEEEIVKKRGLITSKELNDQILIATTTAGALPVQIVSGVGEKVAGIGSEEKVV